MLDVLAQTEGLHHLPSEALARLADLGRPRHFPAGAVLLRQGDPSDHLHVILTGRVRIARERRDDRAPVLLRELGAGEVVGEMGLLDEAPRSVTVTALESTETLELGLSDLAVAIVESPALAAALLRMLSRRLRTLTEQMAGSSAAAPPAAARRSARLSGVRLAARTLEHLLSEQLAATVGYGELLMDDERLPPELREWARAARDGAIAAVATVRRLGRITRLREVATPGGSVLDLDPSQPPAPGAPAGPALR